ncbi:hypothetical protein SDJN03_13628, partial [Cucurbita argyrosperma subsp. sororia]
MELKLMEVTRRIQRRYAMPRRASSLVYRDDDTLVYRRQLFESGLLFLIYNFQVIFKQIGVLRLEDASDLFVQME